MLRLICGYAPQSGRILDEKQSFYDKLKSQLDMHSAGDLFMCLAVFNEHVDWHIDGFDGFHGAYGVGQMNFEGRVLLVFCME